MNEISKYTVLKDLNLVIQYHQDNITFDGLKQIKTQIVSDEHVKSMNDYNTIVDIRCCKITCNLDEIQKYRKYVSQCYPSRDKVHKVAIISNEPLQVAKATMFTISPASDLVIYKIFSTMEGALLWLSRPESQELIIEDTIKKLREKTSLKIIENKAIKDRWNSNNDYQKCV